MKYTFIDLFVGIGGATLQYTVWQTNYISCIKI